MVRLADLPAHDREHLLAKNQPPLGPDQWVEVKKPLRDMRIALITTAGLHFRDEPAFAFTDAAFRPIPAEADAGDLIMSHSSVNFDRLGFMEDVNVVLPIDRLRELARDGTIGSIADVHYSFMGAGLEPEAYENSAAKVAERLKTDRADAVFLTPV